MRPLVASLEAPFDRGRASSVSSITTLARAQAPPSVAGSRFIAMIFIPEELASLHRRNDHALGVARDRARMSLQQTTSPLRRRRS
ncbi:hypothetical protein E4K66_19135 [Bradyrhizobium frederickii]|uniref:Uncharacterized protein n=1 Tax=Bradyrhizobium frederickii TaxID=2560054 RepID=A0A4Y9L4M5_9BRAD|nr:hypothetical protein [Bradyrhizobium frederickii]TFV37637.1 hypothetical protein E4K66_19135 [Bradyrhizobium frederickii]